MERHRIIIYIVIMIVMTNLIRVLPIELIRKRISNRFVRSFLYYVPYVTLAVMTFPAITQASGSTLAGALAFIIGIAGAWFGLGLLPEALICCAVVLAVQFLM
ncbi:MAG: AzlD domain-containing protein [Bacteroidaceae bacterium]|nr:AzlD domain-containing protein [Bacteroidaceae bacterium]